MRVQRHRILGSSILVVDDEPANVALLSNMLEDEGYTNVVSTLDPTQVQDILAKHDFDLILLDMRMPVMSGADVMRALAERDGADWIPVIVLTAQTDDQTREEALLAGANDYLNKPLRTWEVLLRIHNMLEIRQYYLMQKNRADELEEMVRQRTNAVEESKKMLIQRLSRAGEFREDETGNHILRVSLSCELLAKAIGLPPRTVDLIREASPMHDVGKIAIPDYILTKTGPLTEEERMLINRHTIVGSELVGDQGDEVMSMARIMVLYHHEKWDGTGYPHGLRGPGIPLPARIVAICDVFDVLTSERPHKKAWDAVEALNYIHDQAGHHFDPDLARAFRGIFSEVRSLRVQHPD